jgi:hypothetical protein
MDKDLDDILKLAGVTDKSSNAYKKVFESAVDIEDSADFMIKQSGDDEDAIRYYIDQFKGMQSQLRPDGKMYKIYAANIQKLEDYLNGDYSPEVEEGYKILPPIDTERYTEIHGLEGPIRLKSGKVVYYDKTVGKYYDRDTDMYMSDEDYMAHDSGKSLEETQEPMIDVKYDDVQGGYIAVDSNTYDGAPDSDTNIYGFGKTEEDAIENLKELLSDAGIYCGVDEQVEFGGEEETLLKNVPIEALGKEFDRVTSLNSAYLDTPVRQARDAAVGGDESARKTLLIDIFNRLKTRDGKAYKNLLNNLSKYSTEEEVVGDLNNGYGDDHQTTHNYSDFFPTGAHGNVVRDVGPAGGRHGDNPMQKVMKNKKVDEAETKEIHKNLVYEYRKFMEEGNSMGGMSQNDAVDLAHDYINLDTKVRKGEGMPASNKEQGRAILDKLKKGGWWIRGAQGMYSLRHAKDTSLDIPLGKIYVTESLSVGELRKFFWRDHPEFAKYHNSKKRQNDYPATIRSAWVDYIDHCARSGIISDKLAQRATL